MGKKIQKITLYENKTDRVSSSLAARIDEDSNLLLDGYDIGDFVKEHWGDSDYEYWLKVDKEYKDTILLWLIKERFTSDSDFKDWLEEKGIPSDFSIWI